MSLRKRPQVRDVLSPPTFVFGAAVGVPVTGCAGRLCSEHGRFGGFAGLPIAAKLLRSGAQPGKTTGRVAWPQSRPCSCCTSPSVTRHRETPSRRPFGPPFLALCRRLCAFTAMATPCGRTTRPSGKHHAKPEKACVRSRACASAQGALFSGRTLALSRVTSLPEARLAVKMLHWPGLHPMLRRGLYRLSGEGTSKPS